MVTTDFVSRTYRKATGKLPTFTSGSTKWLKILSIANEYIDKWAREPGVDWASLASRNYSIGTVTATDSFTIPAAVRLISPYEGDVVRITHTDGVAYTDYTTIPVEKLKEFYENGGNYCAQQGANLIFTRAFTATDPQFGGTIRIPAYLFATNIVNDADVIPVDDPEWLVLMTAAEFVSSDQTRLYRYPGLIKEANEVMGRMKDDNDAQNSEINRPWTPLAQNWY
ncbi:MAG: hypothetical protein WCJ60_04125 [bacterium]